MTVVFIILVPVHNGVLKWTDGKLVKNSSLYVLHNACLRLYYAVQ
jgi:hypothetical protein